MHSFCEISADTSMEEWSIGKHVRHAVVPVCIWIYQLISHVGRPTTRSEFDPVCRCIADIQLFDSCYDASVVIRKLLRSFSETEVSNHTDFPGLVSDFQRSHTQLKTIVRIGKACFVI